MKILKLIVVVSTLLAAIVSQDTLHAQTNSSGIQVISRQCPEAWSGKPVILAAHQTAPLFACGGADGEIHVHLPQDGVAFSIRSVCKTQSSKSGGVAKLAMSGQTLIAIDEFDVVSVWILANLLDEKGQLLGTKSQRAEIIKEPRQILSEKVQKVSWLGLSADASNCQVLIGGKFKEISLAGAGSAPTHVNLVSFQERPNELAGASFFSVKGGESFFLRERNVFVCENSNGGRKERREILFSLSSAADVRNVDLREGRRLIATSDSVHFWPSEPNSRREEFSVENVVRARFCANGLLVLRDGLQLTYRASSGSVVNFDARTTIEGQIARLKEAAIKTGSINMSSMQDIEPNFVVSDMQFTADRRFFAICGNNSKHIVFGCVR